MKKRLVDRFGSNVTEELLYLFLKGEKSIKGGNRRVYACSLDKSLVVKIEAHGDAFDNVTEWRLWEHFRKTPWAKWLAPCVDISYCGSVLLMKRTTPIKKMPAKVPDFLDDLEARNFGKYKGRIVCHDYAIHKGYEWMWRDGKLRKPEEADALSEKLKKVKPAESMFRLQRVRK